MGKKMKKKVQVILGLNGVLKEGLKSDEFLSLFSRDFSREVIDQHINTFSTNSKEEVNLNLETSSILNSVEDNGISINFDEIESNKIEPLREEIEIFQKKPHFFNMAEEVGTYKWIQEVLKKNNYKSKSIREFETEVDRDNDLLTELKRVDKLSRTIGIYERLKKVEKDGKIHTNFIPYYGLSGRMISHSPSSQNFPSDWKSYLKPINESDFVFELDIKNAEILAIANLIGEDKIFEIMAEGDFYKYVASKILDISEDKVTENIRKTFKKVSNAINYGCGGSNLTAIINKSGIFNFELSPKEGEMIRCEYFDLFPQIKKYQKAQSSTTKLTTAKGHIFNLKEPSYKNISFGPQNIIATLMKNLLVALDEKGYTKNIINIVHDSIWVSCDENILDDIKGVMSNVFCNLVKNTRAEGIELIKSTKLGGNGNV